MIDDFFDNDERDENIFDYVKLQRQVDLTE